LNCLRAFALALLCVAVLPAAAFAQSPSTSTSSTGGASFPPDAPANMTTPGSKAKLLPDGSAAAPANAPLAVQRAIFAANKIQDKPYVYGGGHQSFKSRGYDCSGTVSYMLHGGRLLRSPLDSGSFMSWGARGLGKWITVYTNPGHAYAYVAGLRLDTSRAGMYGVRISKRVNAAAFENGPRWRPTARDNSGFTARHPVGF
jgi:cell wall-associated NlpC family hydrolase